MVHPTTTCQTSKKWCRVAQLQPFHVDLEVGIIALNDAIVRESFEVKGKFPPALKPKLQQLALQVILIDKYNKNFFAQMSQLFPYNWFTMTVRAVWATCFSGTHVGCGRNSSSGLYAEHHQLLSMRQEELLEDSAAPLVGAPPPAAPSSLMPPPPCQCRPRVPLTASSVPPCPHL